MFKLSKLICSKNKLKLINKKINTLVFSMGDMVETSNKILDLIYKKQQLLREIRVMKETYKMLPEKIRRMLFLKYKGFNNTEIANKLKIDVSSISRYMRKYDKGEKKKDETT